MLRDSLPAWVIALFATMMLAAGGAQATPLMAALCNGGSAVLPGQDGGRAGGKDCDKACHAGCQRRRGKV